MCVHTTKREYICITISPAGRADNELSKITHTANVK